MGTMIKVAIADKNETVFIWLMMLIINNLGLFE